ncbi:hypothetical protein [Nostoc sp. KVJ20]|uniref:hypothetical protein n=1 Tax=Nostoc sp. KVJ20 TaxID=457944 RepID=UPI00159F118B|nr:hypothetical protein [Nostoc sp. KVJ20]
MKNFVNVIGTNQKDTMLYGRKCDRIFLLSNAIASPITSKSYNPRPLRNQQM